MRLTDLFERESNILDLNRFDNSEKIYENRKLIYTELEKHCTPWLKAVGASSLRDYLIDNDKQFYRGARIKPDQWIKPIRTDRKPLDMPEPIHEVIQSVYKERGVKANRSNSAFVTKSAGQAQSYGSGYPYTILAVGQFQTSALREVRDLYSIVNGIVANKVAEKYNIYGIKELMIRKDSGKLPEDAYELVTDAIREFINERLETNVDLRYFSMEGELLVHADYLAYLSAELKTALVQLS